MLTLLGKKLYAIYLIEGNDILAYSLGYNLSEAKEHLMRIKEYHKLDGEIVENEELDKELEKILLDRIYKEKIPKIYLDVYKNSEIYLELLNTKRGEIIYYSDLAKKTNKSVRTITSTLKHNPFLILIPCHRVIRKDNKVSEYTPLGKEFKILLLREEGINIF